MFLVARALICINIVALAVSAASTCDLSESRRVRTLLRQLLPLYDVMDVAMPATCPYHPQRDTYLAVERNKTKISRNEWRCDYCDRRFYTEAYLDAHMQRRHVLAETTERGVCLASLAERLLLPADADALACSEKLMRRRRYGCEALIRQCVEGAAQLEFFDVATRAFCADFTCDGDMGEHRRTLYLEQVLQQHGGGSGGRLRRSVGGVLQLVLSFIGAIGVAVYVIIVLCRRRDLQPVEDLKKIQ